MGSPPVFRKKYKNIGKKHENNKKIVILAIFSIVNDCESQKIVGDEKKTTASATSTH